MKDTVKYLFEIGTLKRVARSGWWLAGIKDPETVAEHSFRTAIIGYILGKMENADADRCVLMCLFHDVNEARLNDMHKVVQKYIDADEAEKQINRDQVNRLPETMSADLENLLSDLKDRYSKEAVVAHDADLLECLFQAREYQSQGYIVQDWINTCRAGLQTQSAQKLADECLEMEPSAWWDGLKT
jgi:putative hydrolase of HD superfamily